MRNALTSFGEVAGIGLVGLGLGLAWPPLGVVAAGVGVFAISYRVGSR